MVMGENYLLNRHLAEAGGESLDFLQDKAVDARIDQGVEVFDPVPVAEDQIGVAAVDPVTFF